MAALARRLLGVFFRSIEVKGASQLPTGHPLLLVSNHVNALIDPMLLVGTLPIPVHFLAKSTLWEMALLRPLLRLGRAIPVYRQQDDGVDTSRNQETFARSHELLASGGALALFPEGQSHSEAALTTLRTGAARILLGAEERFGPLGIRVVPVGLVFEDKGRFRSRVLVVVGEALDPAEEVALASTEPRTAAQRLTKRIQDALERVTLNFASWDEALLLGRAVDLFEHPEGGLPRRGSLEAGFLLHRALMRGYRRLLDQRPGEVAAAAVALADYDRALRAAGLEDQQVAAGYPLPSVLSFLARSVLLLILLLPPALAGMLLNWIPYRLAGIVARRTAHRPDEVATWKLLPSLGLFPLYWLLIAVGASWVWQPLAGLAAVMAAPPLGLLSLRFLDRWRALRREARAYLILKLRRRQAARLRHLRRRAGAQVRALAESATSPLAI